MESDESHADRSAVDAHDEHPDESAPALSEEPAQAGEPAEGTETGVDPDESYEPMTRPGNNVRPTRRIRKRSAVAVCVATVALMVLIPAFVARVYTIPSESMETTLHGCSGCDNDRVLVDRLVYRFRDPRPGEVIVFTVGPEVWPSSEVQIGSDNPIIRAGEAVGRRFGLRLADGSDFVKRVVAVGGQVVSCCDERNRIVVDGQSVDEPYLYFSPKAGAARQRPFPQLTVPAGELFVMGDNRNVSVDSRAVGNGPVPLSAVDGKARTIVYPFARSGSIADSDPRTPSS